MLDKEGAANRTGIFMVDASKGFEKDGAKNRLRPRDMHKIVDAYVRQADIARYSRFVPNSEIEDPKNDFNLNIPRYIDSSEPEDIQDLRAHLQGGIPDRDLDDLQLYWEAFPGLREQLFKPLREGYSELIDSTSDIQSAVLGSTQYPAINAATSGQVDHWWEGSRAALRSIDGATRPNELVTELGESLLDAFRSHRLLDEYAVYEQLMSYWNTSMHDDVSLIVGEGWDVAAQPRAARAWKDKNNKTKYEDAHLTFGTGANAKRWVMDLIPPHLIIGRYFAAEQAEVGKRTADLEAAAQAIEEYAEEHAVEDGLLWEAVEDERISVATVKNRLKVAKTEKADAEEIAVLSHMTTLYAAEAAARKAVKDAAAKLDEKALAQYGKLTTDEIKALVIDDKWGATIAAGIESELVAAVQRFTTRLRVLANRYESTVGDLDAAIEALNAKVSDHLAAMGVTV